MAGSNPVHLRSLQRVRYVWFHLASCTIALELIGCWITGRRSRTGTCDLPGVVGALFRLSYPPVFANMQVTVQMR